MKKPLEDKIRQFWTEKNIYEKAKAAGNGKQKYCFIDGPPYATGYIHMGTALNKILKDNYLRFFRMRGFDVWDQPGYDTHGLPIENKVEKKFGFKTKSDIEKYGIENFTRECRNFATEFIGIMSSQFDNLGVWMDWKNPYLTLNNEYIEGAWATFKAGFEKGLLYQGLYPVHVCPHCETAVAYNEIEYTKSTDPSIFVKFPVKGKENEFFLIWTTTPWTLPGNTGIMANPSADYVRVKAGDQIWILAEPRLQIVMEKAGITDYQIIERFLGKSLEGMEYVHPMEDLFAFQKNLQKGHRVVLSEQYVSMEDGTGLVHTAPGHGKEDFKVGMEFGLPALSPTKLNGTFNEECGKYSGKKLKEADTEIVEELDARGLLLFSDKITHDYPQCWRCKSLLLTMSVPQWFFRIMEIKQNLIEENQKVNWQPKWGGQRFQNWLESLGDWPVSRQRYWGIPLPIWICEKCNEIKVIGSAAELPVKPADLHRPFIDNVKLKCKCGSEMKRIPDVLDVWFDSGLASWASLGYPNKQEMFKKIWPADLNIEGSDQIRGWWNSQLITSYMTFGKAPFKNIILHGLVLDLHGSKMSKSLGNAVGPEEVIEKYGRDVLRFYLLSNPPWEDFRFDWREVDTISKSFVVVENTFNFVKTYGHGKGSREHLQPEDKWILSKLNSLVARCIENYSSYQSHKSVMEIRDFIVNDFSRVYIKLIRDRVWPSYEGSDKAAAVYTLKTVAETSLKIMSPSLPHMAEQFYHDIFSSDGESIHLMQFPECDDEMIHEKLENHMEMALRIAETVANMRAEKNIKLRWPLPMLSIECEDHLLAKEMESVLKRMCNVKFVSNGAKEGFEKKDFDGGIVYLDTNITEELKEEALLREVLRKVQEMRKKSGMVITDKVMLSMSGADELKKYEHEMKKEVGAHKVETVSALENGEEVKFEERVIKISISKM